MINAATPLFGVLLAHILTADERLTANRLAGVVIGFAGVAVMMGSAVRAAMRSSASSPAGRRRLLLCLRRDLRPPFPP